MSKTGELQNLWNPFRDWNLLNKLNQIHDFGYKTSETLLGIETHLILLKRVERDATKPLKPF